MRILAVDDDEVILQLLEGALQAVGFADVETAPGPMEALALIEAATTPYDCFLLDIQMPVLDGIALVERIRLFAPYRKVPIVMLTAMSDRDYIDRAFAAGATDYVTKPFDIVELGSRMRMAERLLQEIRAAEQAQQTAAASAAAATLPLDAAIEVEGVDFFLGMSAFENYVATLGRGQYYASNIVALRITNIRAIHRRCDAQDFGFAITDFSEAISDGLRGANGFFTYTGNGVFVTIYNRLNGPEPDDLALDVQDRIAAMDLVDSDRKPMTATLQAGEAISPGVFHRPGSLGVIEKAIRALSAPPREARPAPATVGDVLPRRRKLLRWG